MINTRVWLVALAIVASAAISAFGQSSSLYVAQSDPTIGTPMTPPPGAPGTAGAPGTQVPAGVAQATSQVQPRAAALQASAAISPVPSNVSSQPASMLSPEIADVGLAVARMPEPRKFAVQDLVTIVVRESIENGSESKLDAKKDSKHDAAVSAFPNVRLLQEFSNALITGGLASNPKASVSESQDFKGDGSYDRKDTFTTRITARIIDVKPNGTLVLEARKFIKSDKESVNMILSGTCRREDVTTDNTVLSTQLYDLALVKDHKGQVKDASQKGWLTKFFDGLFGI